MEDSSKNLILEKHISNQALPGENIISWIKWNPEINVEQINIKFEADVILTKVLNVEEKILKKEKQPEEGKISIPKDFFQVPGFIGFTGAYTAVPDKERNVNFVFEFLIDEKIQSVQLSSKIVRPLLQFVGEQSFQIKVGPYNQTITPLQFGMINKGSALAKNAKPFHELLETGDLKLKLDFVTEQNKDESFVFVKTNKITIPKIIIEGQGYGMVSMGFEYEDNAGNKYKTPLANVAIQIEEKQLLEVPIKQNIDKNEEKLLLEAIQT